MKPQCQAWPVPNILSKSTPQYETYYINSYHNKIVWLKTAEHDLGVTKLTIGKTKVIYRIPFRIVDWGPVVQ